MGVKNNFLDGFDYWYRGLKIPSEMQPISNRSKRDAYPAALGLLGK
jgi:hypothetical protein